MAALASSVLHSPLQICSSDSSSSGFLSPPRIHGFAPNFKVKCSSRRPLRSGDGRPRRSFYLKSASDSSPSLVDDYKANSELLASLKIKLLVEELFYCLLVLRSGSAKIKITFQKTTVKATGNLSQLPPLEVPRLPDALRPPSNTGSGDFEVTYLDNDTRITRGDRGELRVFVIS
ncbi:Plastid-lipid-associated protein 6, chloroplastic, partial [Cucurbita argyrosperma subsp. argyrosperma]